MSKNLHLDYFKKIIECIESSPLCPSYQRLRIGQLDGLLTALDSEYNKNFRKPNKIISVDVPHLLFFKKKILREENVGEKILRLAKEFVAANETKNES